MPNSRHAALTFPNSWARLRTRSLKCNTLSLRVIGTLPEFLGIHVESLSRWPSTFPTWLTCKHFCETVHTLGLLNHRKQGTLRHFLDSRKLVKNCLCALGDPEVDCPNAGVPSLSAVPVAGSLAGRGMLIPFGPGPLGDLQLHKDLDQKPEYFPQRVPVFLVLV